MEKPIRHQTVGPYEILAKLGHGGMGIVYKARHQTTNDLVAIKVAFEHVARHPTLSKRFRTDYQVASEVSHPNLVRALDFGEEQGIPYLVMELVVGYSLDQRLKQTGPLEEAEALVIFGQVLEALHFLHQSNIVHRDIKPGNILISESGVAKLADFGLGKNLDSDSMVTHSNVGLGTLEYAAPEQFNDAKHVDLRCDLYSLAAAMYVALSGQYPFGTGPMFTMLQKKVQNKFTPLRRVAPAVTLTVAQVIEQALHPEPWKRPADCAAFLAALGGKPLVPVPASVAGAIAIPDVPERRASVRYALDLNTSCHPLSGGPRGAWEARVVDVSEHGLCLELPRRFEPKTMLQVSLNPGSDEPTMLLVVQTRWVKPSESGSWLIGCTFVTPLVTADLEKLLMNHTEKTRAEGSPP